jgi:HK97 family phage major capsid protein
MPYDSIISRTDASALIPPEQVAEVVKFRQVNMGTKLSSVPVLSAAPTAYFVQGDTGLKQTTEAAWQGVNLTAEEIAALIPIPIAVLDDASIDIWAELRPALAEAVGRVLDLAVFLGTDKPSSWPEAIVPAASAAGNVEAGGATPAEGGIAEDLNQLLGVVEADGFDPSALALSRPLRAVLRSARDTSGQKLADVTSGSYEGVPVAWAGSGVLGTAKALAGDFTMGIIGMRQDMRLEIRTAPWCRTPPGT